MSSNSRNQRDSRRQPEPPNDVYDDDVIFEDSYQFDDGWDDADPYQDPPQDVPPGRDSTSQGTASQLDRLRRNIGLGSGSGGMGRPTRASNPGREASWTDEFEDEVTGPAPEPAPTYRQPERPTSRREPVQPVYDEPEYGEEMEYDVYDQYEDDFSEYDAPRPPARSPRSRPQMSAPSFSRPSLPPAIANADLVNDVPALGLIGAGVAGLVAMAITVANRADSLAPEFATHVSASGLLENFASETALWNLPIMATAFTLMNIAIAWFVSPLDRFASRFVLAGALVVQIMSWVALLRIL